MYIYVTSTNDLMSQPTHTARMIYMGTDVKKAENVISERYQNFWQPNENFPKEPFSDIYSALPPEIQREMIQFYICNEFWYSIELVEFEDHCAMCDIR